MFRLALDFLLVTSPLPGTAPVVGNLSDWFLILPVWLLLGSIFGTFGMLRQASPNRIGEAFTVAPIRVLQLILVNLFSSFVLYYLTIAILLMLEKILDNQLLKCMIAIVFGLAISSPKFGLDSIKGILELEIDSIPVIGKGISSVITFFSDFQPGIIYRIQSQLAKNRDEIVKEISRHHPNSPELERILRNRIRKWEPENQRNSLMSKLDNILCTYSSEPDRLEYLLTLSLDIFTPSEIKRKLDYESES